MLLIGIGVWVVGILLYWALIYGATKREKEE